MSSSSSRLLACVAGLSPLVVALGGPGCAAPQEQQTGTLGNGAFAYACISTDDPECPKDLSYTATAFPTIALGGTFSLTYTANDGSSATVEAASPEFFLSEGQTFTAIRSGMGGFFAETAAQQVLDFTEVTVAPVQSVQVTDTTNAFGDTTTHSYQGTAMGSLGQPLAGVVLYTWSSSDPSVLAIEGGQKTPSNRVTATYGRSGTATLTAKIGDATGSLQVVVEGGN